MLRGAEKKKKEETSRLWNDSIKTAIRWKKLFIIKAGCGLFPKSKIYYTRGEIVSRVRVRSQWKVIMIPGLLPPPDISVTLMALMPSVTTVAAPEKWWHRSVKLIELRMGHISGSAKTLNRYSDSASEGNLFCC